MFILDPPWDPTVGRRGYFIEKVGSGKYSRIFASTFVLGMGTGEIEYSGMLLRVQIGMLVIYFSQLFPFTLRGWVVSSGWEKLVSNYVWVRLCLIFQVLDMLLSPGSVLGFLALAKSPCGWGSDRKDSSWIWNPRWPGVFRLIHPWGHTLGKRGCSRKKVVSG